MNTVVHRRYVSHDDAHYAGGLVDGAYVLRLFGEVATEVSIIDAGDEGLLAGYESVTFHAPVRAGDIIEASGTVVSSGRRSRLLSLTAHVTARSVGDGTSSSARLTQPLLVTSATATVVVPASAETELTREAS